MNAKKNLISKILVLESLREFWIVIDFWGPFDAQCGNWFHEIFPSGWIFQFLHYHYDAETSKMWS